MYERLPQPAPLRGAILCPGRLCDRATGRGDAGAKPRGGLLAAALERELGLPSRPGVAAGRVPSRKLTRGSRVPRRVQGGCITLRFPGLRTDRDRTSARSRIMKSMEKVRPRQLDSGSPREIKRGEMGRAKEEVVHFRASAMQKAADTETRGRAIAKKAAAKEIGQAVSAPVTAEAKLGMPIEPII